MNAQSSLVAALLTMSMSGILAGCGGDESSDDAGTPAASGPVETLPSCDDVWVTGETLVSDYDGCVISGNDIKVFSPEMCPSGAEYASYEDRYYAIPGEVIRESPDGDIFRDEAFQEFAASC